MWGFVATGRKWWGRVGGRRRHAWGRGRLIFFFADQALDPQHFPTRLPKKIVNHLQNFAKCQSGISLVCPMHISMCKKKINGLFEKMNNQEIA
jgi:hypothetical protein